MEALSKAVDSARVENSRKLTESETVHSDHIKALEENYLQLIDTLNSKLKVTEQILKIVIDLRSNMVCAQ